MATGLRDDRTLRPLLAAALGVFCFALLDALLKSVSLALSVSQVVFLRFLFGLAVATVALVLSRQPRPGRSAVRATFVRAVVTVVAVYAFVHALTLLPLATAVVLAYTAPMFMVLFGRILLGEPVTRRAATAMVVGFAGVVTTVSGRLELPDLPVLLTGSLSALLSGASYALSMVLARLRSTEDSVAFTVWGQNAFASLLVLPAALVDWQSLDLALTLSFGAIGSAAVAAQYLVVWAFANATTARIAPLEYTAILWAGLLGYLFFAEQPGPETLLGALMVIASGLLVTRGDPVRAQAGTGGGHG